MVMAEPMTPKQFHEAAGVDWRVLWSVTFAVFRTGDFAMGLKLVEQIGRLAGAAGHHPDPNLRSGRVGGAAGLHGALVRN
jgi:4a-hydroxytetrahydrobiopterin dehydratase